jgi:type VI secretion system protein ImpJ
MAQTMTPSPAPAPVPAAAQPLKHLSRVVWSEGMYLGPHHFQAQRQAFEDMIHFSTSNLWFAPYGFAGYRLDPWALRNGTATVAHARGIFPDGLVFDMPQCDALPAERLLGDFFPPTRESIQVMLSVPAQKPSGPNCVLTADLDEAETRYIAETQSVYDENTGSDARSVSLARKNIRLAFEGEELNGSMTLPIARVTRDGSGHFVFDPSFIPPCLQIGASERLTMILRRLIDILAEKSSSLSPMSRGGSTFRAGFSTGDVASFWFLHAVNSSLTVLRHLFQTERGHPEQVFAEMSRLAGALCTFGMNSHPQMLPVYDHLHLDDCFRALDEHIRCHLELVVPSNCIQIPLKSTGRYTYEGEITDQRCLGQARWILAIQSNVSEVDLISRAPRQVKLCSLDLLPELVKTSLAGLALTHLPVPPSAISPKVEFQYFGVSRTGMAWEHVVQSRNVGLYVPGDIPSPQVELLIVLES